MISTNLDIFYYKLIELVPIDSYLVKIQFISEKLNHFEVNNEIRIKTKLFWFSLFIHLFNVFRYIFYIFLPNDERLLIYFGDWTQYFVSKRHYIIIPFLTISTLNSTMLILIRIVPLDELKWFKLLSFVKGFYHNSPQIIGLFDQNFIKKLLRRSFLFLYIILLNMGIGTTFIGFVNILWICVINYSLFDFIFFGIIGIINCSLWVFYSAGVGSASFCVYLFVSYYLKLRVKQINQYLDRLNEM